MGSTAGHTLVAMVSSGQYMRCSVGGDAWLLMLCPALPCPASQLRWVLFSVQQLLGNGLPHRWQQWQWKLLIVQLPLRDQRHAHRHRDVY